MRALAALLVISVAVAAFPGSTAAFNVVNNGATAYRIDGFDNPTLSLTRGQTYTFNVNAPIHPFYIKTARVTGTGSQYTSGITNNGVEVGTLTWVVPTNAPNQLFYQCGVHSAMGGTINLSGPVNVPPGGTPGAIWLGPATPNPAREGAQFGFGLPREASIDLAVYDPRGRRVRELIRGTVPAGDRTVTWNGLDQAGRRVPNGLYLYRLRVEGRVLSGRLVLAR